MVIIVQFKHILFTRYLFRSIRDANIRRKPKLNNLLTHEIN